MNADFDVRYTAGLARLTLTDEEAAKFQSQISDVLEYAAKLNAVDISGVEATMYANPVFNVVREDEPRDTFTREQALENAPRQANGLFSVPKVIE